MSYKYIGPLIVYSFAFAFGFLCLLIIVWSFMPPKKYDCVKGECKYNKYGKFTSLTDCNNTCKP